MCLTNSISHHTCNNPQNEYYFYEKAISSPHPHVPFEFKYDDVSSLGLCLDEEAP